MSLSGGAETGPRSSLQKKVRWEGEATQRGQASRGALGEIISECRRQKQRDNRWLRRCPWHQGGLVAEKMPMAPGRHLLSPEPTKLPGDLNCPRLRLRHIYLTAQASLDSVHISTGHPGNLLNRGLQSTSDLNFHSQ